MQFKELQTKMYDAMKEKDKTKKDTISAIINTAKNTAINSGDKDNITEEMTDNAIKKELKIVKEQIDTCPKDRTELLDEFNKRLEVVKILMPKQLEEAEIKQILESEFKEVLETKNKGQIMKVAMPRFKDIADGKLVNSIISTYLN